MKLRKAARLPAIALDLENLCAGKNCRQLLLPDERVRRVGGQHPVARHTDDVFVLEP